MKKALSILCIAFSLTAFAQTYSLNTKDGTVSFSYVSESTKGSLTGVEARVNINPSKLSSSTVSGTVKSSTISTGNKTRDQHLKSGDFFDVEKYPEITFETGEITKDGDTYKAKGKLTIKGTTKDVTFTVSESEGVLQFKTTIYATDFGVAVKKDRDSSKVHVLVKIPLS